MLMVTGQFQRSQSSFPTKCCVTGWTQPVDPGLATGHWAAQQSVELQEAILDVIRFGLLVVQDGNGAAQGVLRQRGGLLRRSFRIIWGCGEIGMW